MTTPAHTPPRPHVHGMAPPSRPHHCELSRPLHLHDPRPCSHTRDHGHRLDAHTRCPVVAHLRLAADARIASSPNPRPRLAERLAGKHQAQPAQCPTPAPSLLSWADCSCCNIGPVALCWPSLSLPCSLGRQTGRLAFPLRVSQARQQPSGGLVETLAPFSFSGMDLNSEIHTLSKNYETSFIIFLKSSPMMWTNP